MPVLGDSSRRRRHSPATPWVLLAALVVAVGYGWRWRAQHRRTSLEQHLSTPTELPLAATVSAAPAPETLPPTGAAPTQGLHHVSAALDGALEAAMDQVAGRDTGPALTQVVKRLLVWWMRVPADLQRGDHFDVLYEDRAGGEPVVQALRVVSGKLQRTLEAFRFRGSASEFPGTTWPTARSWSSESTRRPWTTMSR